MSFLATLTRADGIVFEITAAAKEADDVYLTGEHVGPDPRRPNPSEPVKKGG